MEQHPIPQQISSYQFRLVGDMTLKQFFQLAGGLLVGLLFYSSPLLPIIKWPFAIVSAILGVALAFLPLEERPLEKWIFAFFRAIYSPTLYYWKKTATPEKIFQDETAPVNTEVSLPKTGGVTALDKLEQTEKGFLSALSGIFSNSTPTPIPLPNTSLISSPVPVGPLPPPPTAPQPVQIPVMEPIKVVQENKPRLVIEEKKAEVQPIQSFSSSQVNPVIAGNEFISTHQAIFSPMAAPPNLPTIPNIAVGQIIDQERKIVEGAIMEIRDTSGRPVRALRSNKLGHFVIVTPLESGKYEIVTEKDGFEFTPVSFEAGGEIIRPILVSGKNLHPEIL